ncbi:radical SAM protein [Mesorhizobium sp. M1423]|uniref:cyclophane-forming radical SAM/SPASM peptide maturase YhhB n=1 Tax=Mesorhizobium sp. M1423 TaxID=2957101 RepID=UPI003335F787
MHIDTVLLKVASRCNLDCSYCYVFHMGDEGWRAQPKRMSGETQALVGRRLRELRDAQGRPFSVVLHGGEPLLLGARGLGSLLGMLRRALGAECGISIQTNGVLLNADILDLCADQRIGLSVSLDGPAEVHDRFRIDHGGRPSHARVLAGVELLRAHRDAKTLFSGVLAVVDPATSPDAVYDYFRELGVPSVDFLYRDGNHSSLPYGKASVGSTEYGRWITRILNRYVIDPAPFRIRMLDDIIKLALGGGGVKEGVGLTDYGILVIDADGTVKKNDTLKSSPLGDGFSRDWTVRHHSLAEIACSGEFLAYHRAQRPSSTSCARCPHLRICGGGMVAHRFSETSGYENPTVFCADQKMLIERALELVGHHLQTEAA